MTRQPGSNPPPFETKVVGTMENFLFLEQSYCYPRGGGSPGDTGSIISDGEHVFETKTHGRC